MDAVLIKRGVEAPETSSRVSPRTAARYRLAQLLVDEQFDGAVDAATLAYRSGQIEESDFRFVTEIVRAARAKRQSVS